MIQAFLVTRYKFRQFFGPVLKSTGARVAVIVLAVFLLPAGFGFTFILADLVSQPGALETLAATASLALSFLILVSFFGGLLVHQSEIDFLLPTPLGTRSYAIGDLAFQVLMILAFVGILGFPALLGLLFVVGLPGTSVLALAGLLLFFLLFGVALSQSLGLYRMSGGRRRLLLPAALLVLLNLPALQFVTDVPLRYSHLPLPSTAFASAGFALLSGGPVAPLWPLLLGVFGLALAAFYWGITGVYYFPQVRPTMTAGFGAPSLQASARQQQAITRGLSRVTRRLYLSPQGSFDGYLVRYHLVRLVRDGSVFFVSFFLLFFLVLGSQVASGTAPTAALSGLLGFPALLSMAILGMNWLAAERENTWVLLTSSRGTGAYFRALLATLLVVGGSLTGVAALLLAAVGLGFQPLALLAALTGVTAGSTTLVLLLERWRIPATSFSLRIPLLFLFPAIAFALGFLPITVLESSPVVVGGFVVPPAFLAVGVLLVLLGGGLRLVRVSSRRFSLEIPTP